MLHSLPTQYLLRKGGSLRLNGKYLIQPVIERALLLTAVSETMKGSEGGPRYSIPFGSISNIGIFLNRFVMMFTVSM